MENQMSAECISNHFPDILSALVCFFCIYILSIIYLIFYNESRKIGLSKSDIMKIIRNNAIKCICANLFLVFFDPFFAYIHYRYILLILIGLTENLDFFIHKIPTEFLVLEFLFIGLSVFPSAEPRRVIFSVLISGLWLFIRKKIRIGFHDILLILILTIALSDVIGTILFNSVIMMIWGLIGFILQQFFGKEKNTEIPLAPVIISAFTLMKLFL